MTFAYYARLSRAQQAVYRRSDTVTEIRLARPHEFQLTVEALGTALVAEDRLGTQRAAARLLQDLTAALGVPPVRVEVLAARPHARWGELHGLYTADRRRPAKIQLWMRTAKQKRVVAFRTFLRTLLHEVGHHLDYTLLGLSDSFHTEGFYKRESSLFHQLVPERRTTVPTIEDYAKQSAEQRLQRLARTADELAATLRGQGAETVSRRPDAKNWAAVEIVGHLRDVEEMWRGRFEMIMAMDEPKFLTVDPDRWAEERQYLGNDVGRSLGAFRRRREETLAFLRPLAPAQWQRAGVHATRGRMTVDTFVAMMAWHDDNHLDQLQRALAGRP